jgi:hypothetical protein
MTSNKQSASELSTITASALKSSGGKRGAIPQSSAHFDFYMDMDFIMKFCGCGRPTVWVIKHHIKKFLNRRICWECMTVEHQEFIREVYKPIAFNNLKRYGHIGNTK